MIAVVLTIAVTLTVVAAVAFTVTWGRVVADAARYMQPIHDHHRTMDALGRVASEQQR